MKYQNKIVLITGAYRGIGKEIACFFAEGGANLIITYHNHYEDTIKLQNELVSKYQVNVDVIYLDLCKERCIQNMYNHVKNAYGHIDILVNNSSISLDSFYMYKTKEEFMKVLEVNVVGTFLMIKYFNDLIHSGYIFNISSTDGIDTGSIYSIDYNASKAGINSLTKTISLVIKNKIISICPNWVDTESTMEMDSNYLNSELERIKQEKLISSKTIPLIIDKCIKENIESGSIVRIDGDMDE